MDNRSINEIILRCEGAKTTNDVSVSGSAEHGVMLVEDHDENEDDWIPLDKPDSLTAQGPNFSSSPALSDGEMVLIDSQRDLGNGDVDVLAEIRTFLWILLHHVSQKNPRLMLSALLQCFSIYLYVRAYVYSVLFLVAIFVYNLPVIQSYVDIMIERKQLNRVTFGLIMTYHYLQIQSIGYMLNYLNYTPLSIRVCTYLFMIIFLMMIIRRKSSSDLRALYPYTNTFLYTATLCINHYYPIETTNRTIIEANFLQFMSVTILRGNLDLFENIKKSMKTYSLEKFDVFTQDPKNSAKLFTFVVDYLASDNGNIQNEEFSISQELRKIDSSKLNEDYKNVEKIVRNIEVTASYSYLYYVRNAFTILAFLDGSFYINVGSLILILLETITLFEEPFPYDDKKCHHLFFGGMSNLANLHDRLLSTLRIYQGVVVSVTGYQATMAVYDSYIALKNVWSTISGVTNR